MAQAPLLKYLKLDQQGSGVMRKAHGVITKKYSPEF